MNNKLYSRLTNWKFTQALQYLKGEPEETQEVVRSLANLLGNVGWDGCSGDLGVIVTAALRGVGVFGKE